MANLEWSHRDLTVIQLLPYGGDFAAPEDELARCVSCCGLLGCRQLAQARLAAVDEIGSTEKEAQFQGF
jgi:hypothetical protein